MNGKVIKTNTSRKFFAMFLVASLVISLFAVGFSASADTGAVSPSDAVASDTVTATDTVETDTVSAADTITASDTPVVYESEPIMMFAAAPAPDDIASGTSGTCSWIIDANGVLTIFPTDGVSGTLARTGTSNKNTDWGWKAYAAEVTAVKVESTVYTPETAMSLFYHLTNCKSMDLSGLNTSNTTDTSCMFAGCSSLTSLDVRGLDVSKVTTMNSMFYGCSGLTSLNLSGWNTSAVKNMSKMFSSCKSLPSLDVTGFDTSNVTDMSDMFFGCQSLSSLDLSNFNTSKVTNMYNMFYNCKNMTAVDVTSFNTSNVTNFCQMFSNCSNLTALDVSGFDTSSATTMNTMFGSCSKLKNIDVSNFDTSKVTDFSQMFTGCNSLEAVNVSGFNTQNATRMNNMFRECSSLKAVDVSKFDTSKVTNMSWMFDNCRSLTELNVSNFDTANVTSMWGMFSGCSGLSELDVRNFDTAKVTDMRSMFNNCSGLSELDVRNFDTAKVTDMRSMFNNCSGLSELDLSSFDTSKVTDMDNLFYNDTKLDTISVSADFTPASNYEAEDDVNFFNVVDGNLIVEPKEGYAIKSVTVDGQPVEFDVLGGEYDGFTGDSVAVITYSKAMTVAFMDGETEVDNQTVAQGNDANDPYADESKIIGVLGKHFTGWDKIFTNVQQDITVKALYEFNDYVLAFDANGGEGDMAPVAFKYDTAQEIPENTFTKEGYTFVGWNTAADLSGDSYDDKATVKNLTDEHDVTVTFYAQWLINTYSVSFMDSADDSLIEDVPVEYGDSVTAPTVSNVVGWSTAKNGTTEADLSKVTGNMTVWAIYRDEYTGAPSVVFDKESKTFDINEEIKFKAVGYWADSKTTEFLDGDERYVPTNWHHAEPSGDFGGKTAPTDTYSASFKQSAAGTYTLKVEFAKSVYADGAWVDDGTVTVETEYKVVAPSAGDAGTDSPKTGDTNEIVMIASNVMLICAVGMFLTWREIKRKKENA